LNIPQFTGNFQALAIGSFGDKLKQFSLLKTGKTFIFPMPSWFNPNHDLFKRAQKYFALAVTALYVKV